MREAQVRTVAVACRRSIRDAAGDLTRLRGITFVYNTRNKRRQPTLRGAVTAWPRSPRPLSPPRRDPAEHRCSGWRFGAAVRALAFLHSSKQHGAVALARYRRSAASLARSELMPSPEMGRARRGAVAEQASAPQHRCILSRQIAVWLPVLRPKLRLVRFFEPRFARKSRRATAAIGCCSAHTGLSQRY